MSRVFQQATRVFTIAICLTIGATLARADVKIKSKSTQSSNVSEQTTYIKGRRQRVEMMNGMMISLTQCDLKRYVQLNPQSKTYIVSPFNQPTASAERATAQPSAKKEDSRRGGVITTTVTAKDTGERKQIFGYPARRYITTIATDSSPEACNKIKSKMEMDAWYIDLAFEFNCNNDGQYQNYTPSTQDGCRDRSEVKQIGQPARGYPVVTKTTMFDESGNAMFSMEQEVTEISQTPLDAALFDVPADYKEVKNFSEPPIGAAITSEATRDAYARSNDSSGMSANVKNMADKQARDLSSEVGAKKEGVIRLGLVGVKTGSVGDGLSATELAAAVQNTMTQYLKGPDVELVLIEAKLPSQIEAEAKQKECDYVIYTNVEHKKGGSKFGSFAPALSSVASLAGYSGSTAGAVAGHVASTAIITAATISNDIKAKDQLTLDIKLQSPAEASAIVVRQFKAKAQSNGEDIISPVIEQAAQAILTAAVKR